MARGFRWSLSLLAAIMTGIFVALVALSYGWQRPWLTQQVANAATNALGRPVQIGTIEGVLHREISIGGVQIGIVDAPLVTIDQLQMQLESLALGGESRLILSSLRVAGVDLQIRQAKDGSWPWQEREGAMRDEGSVDARSTFLIELRSVALLDVNARIEPQGQRAIVLGLDADAEGVSLGTSSEVEQLVASFDATAREGLPEQLRIGGRLAGSFSEGEWRLAELEAESEELSFSAKGRGNLERILEVRVVAEVASLSTTLSPVGGLDGSLRLRANVSGAYAWPLGEITLEGDSLGTEEYALGDFRLKVRTTGPGRLEVDAFSLDYEKTRLLAEPGAVLLIGDELIQIENLSFRRDKEPGSIRVKASLPHAPGQAAGITAVLRDARTRADFVSSEFPLETFQPLLRLWNVAARGQLDFKLRLRGAPAGPRVEGFIALASSEIALPTVTAQGLDFRVDLAGTLEGPVASVAGSAQRLAAADQEWGAFSIAAELGKSEARIDRLRLEDGPWALRVRPGSRVGWSGGQIHFRDFSVEDGEQMLVVRGLISRDRADGLEVELRRVEPGHILERLHALGFVEEEYSMGGIVNGELFASGTRTQPDIRARLEWSNPQLDEFSFETIRANVETEDALVRVSTDWVQRGKAVAEVAASLPRNQTLVDPAAVAQNPETRVQAELNQFELGSLSAFLPPSISSLRGKMSVSLHGRGAPAQPELSGNLMLAEGGLKLTALGGQSFAPIAIRAALREGAIEIESLQVGEEAQRVAGEATVLLDGTKPSAIDSQLTFYSYPVDAPGLVKGRLSGPLRLTGELSALELTGNLEIAELLVRIPDPGDATLKEIRIVSTDTDAPLSFEEGRDALSFLDPLGVSVDMKLAKNSWARGRGAEIELRGELSARKERGDALRLSGSVNAVRGTYEVYGRRFRIERGEVVLDGGIEADPVVGVRALHRVRGVKIYAIIEGRLSEPRLRFESNPELDETDIASYLLFGRPASGSAGEEQLALEAVAAQVAVGVAIREFEKKFGGALPVDLIDLRMDNEGDEREFRAGVGKYIGDRLFLHYERGFGDEPDDELKAEYELTPVWSLESTVSSNGDTAGDVVFEIEY